MKIQWRAVGEKDARLEAPSDPAINLLLQQRTFYGKEEKSLAYVIAIMNMILRGIDAPNIVHTNTLTENLAVRTAMFDPWSRGDRRTGPQGSSLDLDPGPSRRCFRRSLRARA